MKFLTNLDLSQNEIQNAVIQPLAAAPANPKMPPTRGHDLKQLVRGPMRVPGGDASTPGNVLKYFAPHLANTPGDAPTVSLLSVLLSSLFSLTLF